MSPKFLTFLFLFLFGCIFDKNEEYIPPPLVVADIHGCWLIEDNLKKCNKICFDSSGYYYNLTSYIAEVDGKLEPQIERYGNITFVEQYEDKSRGGGYIGENLTRKSICIDSLISNENCIENNYKFNHEQANMWVKNDVLYSGSKAAGTRMTHIDEACFSHGYTTGGLIDFDVMFK